MKKEEKALEEAVKSLDLNINQKNQIIKQLKSHQHENYETDLIISSDFVLENFSVYKGIMRPEIMTSLYFARFLFKIRNQFHNKVVLDLGCGSGILGTVMALCGAKRVYFSDIDKTAIQNTEENIKKFIPNYKHKTVLKGPFDLFDGFDSNFKFDIIVFAQPYFSETYIKNYPVTQSMMIPLEKINQFFNEAQNHFTDKIIMPRFGLTSVENDPLYKTNIEKYKVSPMDTVHGEFGLQVGKITFCELTKK